MHAWNVSHNGTEDLGALKTSLLYNSVQQISRRFCEQWTCFFSQLPSFSSLITLEGNQWVFGVQNFDELSVNGGKSLHRIALWLLKILQGSLVSGVKWAFIHFLSQWSYDDSRTLYRWSLSCSVVLITCQDTMSEETSRVDRVVTSDGCTRRILTQGLEVDLWRLWKHSHQAMDGLHMLALKITPVAGGGASRRG